MKVFLISYLVFKRECMSVSDWEELWEHISVRYLRVPASSGDQTRIHAYLYSYHIKMEPESEDLFLL